MWAGVWRVWTAASHRRSAKAAPTVDVRRAGANAAAVRRWLVGCCVAGLLVPACERAYEAPEVLGPPGDPGGALPLTLVSFNLRYEHDGDGGWKSWPRRLQLVVSTIRGMDPDVMGVQEGLHGQIADLRASLPDYGFHGIGRDDGRRAGEYAGIFWKRARFVADGEDRGTFWLSSRPEQAGSRDWGNSVVRSCAWQRLIDRETGRGFTVYNTHWDHRHQGSRERSARLIAERIDGRRHADDPVVLVGDLNANESNPAHQYLTGRRAVLGGAPAGPWAGALKDSFTAIHGVPNDRRTLHFWKGNHEDPWKVDHIFVSKEAEIRDAQIVDVRRGLRLPSDHYPVRSVVEFPPLKE